MKRKIRLPLPKSRKRSGGTASVAPRESAQLVLPRLVMPAHHDVRAGDVVPRRLAGALAAAAEAGPRDFAQLLLVPGVGARTVRALALIAEERRASPALGGRSVFGWERGEQGDERKLAVRPAPAR